MAKLKADTMVSVESLVEFIDEYAGWIVQKATEKNLMGQPYVKGGLHLLRAFRDDFLEEVEKDKKLKA